MILYHGSNVMIDRIDLSKSRPFKDFGRAFYLSADEQQAWERAVAAMTMWGGSPCVTSFEFDEALMSSEELKVKTFEAYTEEWADFIFAGVPRPKGITIVTACKRTTVSAAGGKKPPLYSAWRALQLFH